MTHVQQRIIVFLDEKALGYRVMVGVKKALHAGM